MYDVCDHWTLYMHVNISTMGIAADLWNFYMWQFDTEIDSQYKLNQLNII